MATQKIEQGTIVVVKTQRGWDIKFRKASGAEMTIFSQKEEPVYQNQAGTLTSLNGRPLLLELNNPRSIIFGKESIKGEESQPIVTPIEAAMYPDSFSIQRTVLPDETKVAILGFSAIDNFHLKFYKCARLELDEGKPKFQTFKSDKGKVQYGLKARFERASVEAIAARAARTVQAQGFTAQHSNLVSLEAKSTWRWVTGLGNPSVYENGMTLHHVYGIPYMQGSGVKGMLRTWIIQSCFGRSEAEALKNPAFQTIFGYPDPENDEGGKRGEAVFFDAFPLDPPDIGPDVMNNHYQDYYDGHTPPADWLNPNPIFFMSVKNARLRFQVGIPDGNRPVGEAAAQLLSLPGAGLGANSTYQQLLQAWLHDALAHHGIGAKTAVGYGRMVSTLPASH